MRSKQQIRARSSTAGQQCGAVMEGAPNTDTGGSPAAPAPPSGTAAASAWHTRRGLQAGAMAHGVQHVTLQSNSDSMRCVQQAICSMPTPQQRHRRQGKPLQKEFSYL